MFETEQVRFKLLLNSTSLGSMIIVLKFKPVSTLVPSAGNTPPPGDVLIYEPIEST